MSEFTQAFPYMADHLSYLSHLLVKHIELAGATLVVATAIALPLGVVLGHAHRFSWLAINIANAGRALPSLGIIAIGLGILGIRWSSSSSHRSSPTPMSQSTASIATSSRPRAGWA